MGARSSVRSFCAPLLAAAALGTCLCSPASAQDCVGDCNADGSVTVDEVVRGVSIALGKAPATDCPAMDASGDGRVTVDELVAAVTAALSGCGRRVVTTADGLRLELSPQGEQVGLEVNEHAVGSAGAVLRVRELTGANARGTNLLGDPSFEQAAPGGAPGGWTELWVSGAGARGRVGDACSSSPAKCTHTGEQALHFEGAGFIALASEVMPVDPTKRYRVSAWWFAEHGYVRKGGGNPPTSAMAIYRSPRTTTGLFLEWLDSAREPTPLSEYPQLAVPLHFNTGDWKLIQREIRPPENARNVRVVLAADLAHHPDEHIWADDVRFIESPEKESELAIPVETAPGGSLRQAGQSTELGLGIDVTYVPHGEHIAIQGAIENLRPESVERAMDVTVSFPIEAAEWTFWDNAHDSRVIEYGNGQEARYANVLSAVSNGWLPMSLYPYAGVEGNVGNGRVGIAVAVPPDRPQLAVLQYDAANRSLQATFHLGFSDSAGKLENKARFALILFALDSEHGFRGMISKYAGVYPDFHDGRVRIEDYADYFETHLCRQSQAAGIRAANENNVFVGNYVMLDFWLQNIPCAAHPCDGQHPVGPSLFAMRDSMEGWAVESWQEDYVSVEGNYCGDDNEQATIAGNAEKARAFFESAVVDDNGDRVLHQVGNTRWHRAYWTGMWAENPDPDIVQGVGRWLWYRRVLPALEITRTATPSPAHVDGIRFDNFGGVPAIDRSTRAVASANDSLTYSPHTYAPGVHSSFALFEFLEDLRARLDDYCNVRHPGYHPRGYVGMGGNIWSIGHPNYLGGFLDQFGGEGTTEADGQGDNWNPEVLGYRRAVALRRSLAFSNFSATMTETSAENFAALALLHGVHVVPVAHNEWCPGDDGCPATCAFEKANNLGRQYSAAGWEPVTHATTQDPEIWTERFGDGLEGGVFFAVHNRRSSAEVARVSISIDGLGLPGERAWLLREVVPDLSLEANPESVCFDTWPAEEFELDGAGSVTLTIGARRTRIVELVAR